MAASARAFACPARMLSALLLCAFTIGATAQQPAGPAVAGGTAAGQAPKQVDNAHVSDRPYNAIFTKPQFPSTGMQQKQFTLQYVYNYAESTYTPAVPLPSVGRSTAKFDTPENALIALYSSMRAGDYDAFLNCWDEPSRAGLEAQAKTTPEFKNKLMANWKTMVAGKPILLTHRLDTVNYIILDATIQNANGPGKSLEDPEVLVFEKGRWVFSNKFRTDGLVSQHAFTAPGKVMGDKVTYNFDLRPLLPEPGPGAAANHAQQAFLKTHNRSAAVTETVE